MPWLKGLGYVDDPRITALDELNLFLCHQPWRVNGDWFFVRPIAYRNRPGSGPPASESLVAGGARQRGRGHGPDALYVLDGTRLRHLDPVALHQVRYFLFHGALFPAAVIGRCRQSAGRPFSCHLLLLLFPLFLLVVIPQRRPQNWKRDPNKAGAPTVRRGRHGLELLSEPLKGN